MGVSHHWVVRSPHGRRGHIRENQGERKGRCGQRCFVRLWDGASACPPAFQVDWQRQSETGGTLWHFISQKGAGGYSFEARCSTAKFIFFGGGVRICNIYIYICICILMIFNLFVSPFKVSKGFGHECPSGWSIQSAVPTGCWFWCCWWPPTGGWGAKGREGRNTVSSITGGRSKQHIECIHAETRQEDARILKMLG